MRSKHEEEEEEVGEEEMKPILNLIDTLYMATIMEKNISWFVISGILKVSES